PPELQRDERPLCPRAVQRVVEVVAARFGAERRGAVVGDATIDGIRERRDVTPLHVGAGRRRVVAVALEVDGSGDTTERNRHQYSFVSPSASSARGAPAPSPRTA